jgi:hypothetical protein
VSQHDIPVVVSPPKTHTSPGFDLDHAPQDIVRYLGIEQVDDRLKWDRITAAMNPESPNVKREDILTQFLNLVYPDNNKKSEALRSKYRDIGALTPSHMLKEPERFYRSTPMAYFAELLG